MASSWILFFSYQHDARSNTHQMRIIRIIMQVEITGFKTNYTVRIPNVCTNTFQIADEMKTDQRRDGKISSHEEEGSHKLVYVSS